MNIPQIASLLTFINQEVLDDYTKNHHKDFPLKEAIHYILYTLFMRRSGKLKSMLLSHSPNNYTDTELTYNSIQTAIKLLLQKNIIHQKEKGYINLIHNPDPNGKYKYVPKEEGITSSYKLCPITEWKVDNTVGNRYELYLDITNQRKTHNAEIRKKYKENGKIINEVLEEFIDPDIEQINKYLLNRGHPELMYTRIFHKDKDGDLIHGRFYMPFQNLPKKEREVVYEELGLEELDMHAMAPNTLYMLETGLPFNGDVYNHILEQLELPSNIYRPLVKKCMLSVIGSSTKQKAIESVRQTLTNYGMYYGKKKEIPVDMRCCTKLSCRLLLKITPEKHLQQYKSIFFNKYLKKKKEYSEDIHYFINPEYFLEQIEKAHAPIANHFYKNRVDITTTIESELMISTLKYMTYQKDLPLAIHDCIIIPKSKKHLYSVYINKQLFIIINNINNNNIYKYNINKHISNSNNNINNNINKFLSNNNNFFKVEQTQYLRHIIMKNQNILDKGGG